MKKPDMTRQALYDLVWSKPMTHIAKEFGMSDVAVRKHCVKHDIPTPPVGYWTKLKHGKSVRKAPLPTRKQRADEPVYLVGKDVVPRSTESALAASEAESRRAELAGALVVPESLPAKPHRLIRHVRGGLRRTKADGFGFLNLEEASRPDISIGRASIDRVLLILHVLMTVAEAQEHEFLRDEHGFYWVVQEERFLLRIYEIHDRKPHEPTPKELKEQARQDEWRAKYPESYSSSRKVYRSWDEYPSGRLTIALRDTNSYGWREQALSKRWRDTKTVSVESRLPDIFTWLEPAAVMAREQRLEIEERRRREAEEAERRRRLRERRAQAEKLEKYLDELCDTLARANRLGELVRYLEGRTEGADTDVGRVIREAKAYQLVLEGRLSAQKVLVALEKMGVCLDEEPLMPVLDQVPEAPRYSW